MEDCGVKYEYVNSENQWDLMAGGKNDINYGLLPTFVQRIANGYKMKIVGGAHFGCINMVATDASGIQSIKDLKGKKCWYSRRNGIRPGNFTSAYAYCL